MSIQSILRSSGFDCSTNQLHKGIVDYLKTHRKNEKGQSYELFAGIPWGSYLNEMRLNGTYGNCITLYAISRMHKVQMQVMSSLGPQATVNISQENGRQRIVLGHYAEWQGDHYVCLRSTPNFDGSEYEYDKPISNIDNIQTELDEHSSDMYNIQTKLNEHNIDMNNIKTEFDEHSSDMDNIQTELGKNNSDMDNI